MRRKNSTKNLSFKSKNVAAYEVTAGWGDVPGAFLTIPKDGVYELRYSTWVDVGIDGVYSFGEVAFELNGTYIDKTSRKFRIENDNATYARRRFDCFISKMVECKAGDIFTVVALEDDSRIALGAGVIEYHQIR